MRPFSVITILIAMTLVTLPATMLLAGDDGGKTTESVEVKRAKDKAPKHPTLRFLHDNRVFLRAQLDRLRMQTKLSRNESAEILDERMLMLKEMAAAIAAARDTVETERRYASERELLESVTELGALENQLALMEHVLDEQRQRLLVLEQDFLGHQETALVVLVKGLLGKNAPQAIVISQEEEVVTIDLDPEQRRSLEQGGIAQVYHEFVEPREHVITVAFVGDRWTQVAPVEVSVETARDRLTFLELDLRELDRDRDAAGLLTTVWYR